jgi:raffinose/stachyose/melibiose transport system substrate-binding protein
MVARPSAQGVDEPHVVVRKPRRGGDMEDFETAGGLSRAELIRRGAALAAGATMFGSVAESAFARTVASNNIEVWAWQPRTGNGYPDVFDAAGKRWQAAHKGGHYHYTVIDFPSYFTKFKTASAGGNPPDVMEMSWTGQYHDVVAAKTLAPLDALLPSLPKFYPAVLNSLRVNGKVYAIPLDLNTLTISYNKDIFAKLNLTPPTTFAELLALAKPIRAGGFEPLAVNLKDGWPAGDIWFAMVGYTDPSDKAIRQAETGAVKWTDPRFLKAAEAAQSIQKAGLFAQGSDSLDFNGATALFASGRAAMFYPVGNFDTGVIDKASGGNVKYDLFPFPPLVAGQRSRATGGPAIIWSVPAKAKNQKGAFDYLKLSTDAASSKELIKRNFIPASKANISSNNAAIYHRMVGFQPTAATRAIFLPKVYTALTNTMTALLSGSGSPQDVVNEMENAAK